jgi:serine/threonine protein kinase
VISAGSRLGPYESLSPLGAGGMGEVWKARDTRLNRTLEIATGKRTVWKKLAADPVGLLYGNVILARDGQHYVYRLRRVLSELNVAEGLK